MNVTSSGTKSGAADSSGPAASNPNGLGKEDFLKLLVAQLAHQSPLNPLDSTAFVAQLAQFSSLEQLAGVNLRLDTLAMGQAGLIAGQAVNLVGRTIVYPGKDVFLAEGAPARFRYDLASPAAEVEIVIRNQSGAVVRRLFPGALGAGPHEGVWDGLDEAGQALPKGRYTVEVTAAGPSGVPVGAAVYSIGKVTGISFKDGFPELMVGDARVKSADVVEVIE